MATRAARLSVCVIACLLVTAVRSHAADAAIYQVPAEITAESCSAPVEDEIMAWLATVPDGNTAQFAPDGCYGQDGTITVPGRTDLVIDGQGAEFRALTPGGSHRANWRFTGGANLTVQNMAVRGRNPNGEYVPEIEWQHGYSVEGVQSMTLSNVQARETWGDGVYIAQSTITPACGDDATSARNVVITGATLERNGRQGVAISDAEHVTLQDSTIGPVAWWSVDIETDRDCDIARHINIVRNQFGANRYGVIGSVGFGAYPHVGDVTAIDNTQTVATQGLPGDYCWAPVWILSPVDAEGNVVAHRTNYVFRGNRLLGTRNGFEFRGVDNIEVSANNVTLTPTTGCGKRAGVLLVDSDTVGITANAFRSASNVFTADTLSTGITAEGNWMAETWIDSGPEGGLSSSSASFAFSSDGVGGTFECKLDEGAFEPCSAPKEYAALADGVHTFQVRAIDAGGNPDPSPASRTWSVDTVVTPASAAPATTTTTATQPPPPDTTSPPLRLSAALSQRVLRKRGVLVAAASPAEASTVAAEGKVVIRGSAKVFRLTPATKRIAAGGTAVLKLKLKQSALAAIRRALKAGKRVNAKVTVTAQDAAGNLTTKRRTIKLKR